MFKRRNPYETESTSTLVEEPQRSLPERGVIPRSYEPQETPAPYRTPAQAYPRHREEAQDALNEEVTQEELWRTGFGRGAVLPGPGNLEMEEPETVLGEGISIKGELEFQRFLRVDGEFEGNLLSDGKIVVGPTGVVRANIELNEAVIEGRVEGNIVVRGRCELRGDAVVIGNITAKLLSVDEGVSIRGEVNITPTDAS